MIEGVKIEVTTKELQAHVEARAEYHTGRAEFYTQQVASLRAGGVRAEAQSNDPTSSLEGSAKSHRERASLFRFISEHLIPNETYRLSENDLTRLELVSRYF